jgi:hypothetical protein
MSPPRRANTLAYVLAVENSAALLAAADPLSGALTAVNVLHAHLQPVPAQNGLQPSSRA